MDIKWQLKQTSSKGNSSFPPPLRSVTIRLHLYLLYTKPGFLDSNKMLEKKINKIWAFQKSVKLHMHNIVFMKAKSTFSCMFLCMSFTDCRDSNTNASWDIILAIRNAMSVSL